jgi:MFS family permease
MVTSERTKWFALALLCAVQFMVILDVSIVNVALPSIQTDLGFSQENLQWVLSAYALVFGGFPPLRRPPCRHPRTQTRLRGRPRRLHGRFALLRLGIE